MKNKITVFSLSSSKKLAQDIASILGTKVGDCKVHHFADGEILCEIGESVRGKDVFIVQSTSNPVTENLMEILVLTDALKRASAREITAVIPYFGYARQDRKAKPRQPITSKLVADLLTTAGVNRVVTVDLHAAQIQGFFDIPVDEMQALPLLIKYFRKKKVQDLCVVSPDHGGATRARKMSEAFDCPIAIIDKRRPKPNVAEVMGIIGNVEGKNCILIDDMIDTAGTITAGVDMLKQKGAKDVYIACTHGVLSGPAIERLSTCAAKEVVITNTIEIPQEKKFDKLVSVSVAGLLAHTIENIENDLPVSDVFTQYDC
ncbi:MULTISPECIES: ribose-phosphate diphosphokinase [Catenibacterium]|jgi:ribose-phosphate pyrophosphokinase|uniref:ribose-phosphate diphosphokinase n=1 Tax=Catenibacterium TaxID=135858 RepID=UPI0003373F48|nr:MULTISPECIES: ribose-phosphate pyrophosphokinase [Catenibacterium]MBD9189891.1 ribose-phosphate pyrophosphokinase [Catenibacterium mitsuokai]MBU9057952.1 ribose-phosphate pyrophosphokinase [Catenibacterium mitsuokai]MCB5428716.1 ribose-phosphate pyrophosphokinase [Catenibacterium mitsuokai]MEE0491041.1 ribose-phosphate pyrophosphokinase [Catenibacterium sp.]CDE28060.1 ribose-phosphate pyrophosphokinase [Catenibacterium sp. CAG:290]